MPDQALRRRASPYFRLLPCLKKCWSHGGLNVYDCTDELASAKPARYLERRECVRHKGGSPSESGLLDHPNNLGDRHESYSAVTDASTSCVSRRLSIHNER